LEFTVYSKEYNIGYLMESGSIAQIKKHGNPKITARIPIPYNVSTGPPKEVCQRARGSFGSLDIGFLRFSHCVIGIREAHKAPTVSRRALSSLEAGMFLIDVNPQ
jgi:hypothetical protein